MAAAAALSVPLLAAAASPSRCWCAPRRRAPRTPGPAARPALPPRRWPARAPGGRRCPSCGPLPGRADPPRRRRSRRLDARPAVRGVGRAGPPAAGGLPEEPPGLAGLRPRGATPDLSGPGLPRGHGHPRQRGGRRRAGRRRRVRVAPHPRGARRPGAPAPVRRRRGLPGSWPRTTAPPCSASWAPTSTGPASPAWPTRPDPPCRRSPARPPGLRPAGRHRSRRRRACGRRRAPDRAADPRRTPSSDLRPGRGRSGHPRPDPGRRRRRDRGRRARPATATATWRASASPGWPARRTRRQRRAHGRGGGSPIGRHRPRPRDGPGSNYGARVDLQGFGAGVVTTGYGEGIGPPGPRDRAYTSCFDGTSSASATVAGAVAALQGLAIDPTAPPLTPAVRARPRRHRPRPSRPGGRADRPAPQVAAAAALVGAVAPPPARTRRPRAARPLRPRRSPRRRRAGPLPPAARARRRASTGARAPSRSRSAGSRPAPSSSSGAAREGVRGALREVRPAASWWPPRRAAAFAARWWSRAPGAVRLVRALGAGPAPGPPAALERPDDLVGDPPAVEVALLAATRSSPTRRLHRPGDGTCPRSGEGRTGSGYPGGARRRPPPTTSRWPRALPLAEYPRGEGRAVLRGGRTGGWLVSSPGAPARVGDRSPPRITLHPPRVGLPPAGSPRPTPRRGTRLPRAGCPLVSVWSIGQTSGRSTSKLPSSSACFLCHSVKFGIEKPTTRKLWRSTGRSARAPGRAPRGRGRGCRRSSGMRPSRRRSASWRRTASGCRRRRPRPAPRAAPPRRAGARRRCRWGRAHESPSSRRWAIARTSFPSAGPPRGPWTPSSRGRDPRGPRRPRRRSPRTRRRRSRPRPSGPGR